VFVTPAIHTGLLGGLEGADAICAAAASDANLEGNYLAWLSTSTVDAKDRFGTAQGWVRPDGRVVANTVAEIVAGRMVHPIRLYANGDLVSNGVRAWTGTGPEGTTFGAQTCGDWSSDSVDDSGTLGNPAGVALVWTFQSTPSCDVPHALYCFGVDHATSVTPATVSGRYAFLSGGLSSVGGGLAGADAHCQATAEGAGLDGTYLALLATTAGSAASRFSVDGGPWTRRDGVPLTETADELLAGADFLAGPNVEADGGYEILQAHIWLGATSITSLGASTCVDWTSNAGSVSGRAGTSYFVNSLFFSQGGNYGCGTSGLRLFCLQQ
jgi:hypothetical protein